MRELNSGQRKAAVFSINLYRKFRAEQSKKLAELNAVIAPWEYSASREWAHASLRYYQGKLEGYRQALRDLRRPRHAR